MTSKASLFGWAVCGPLVLACTVGLGARLARADEWSAEFGKLPENRSVAFGEIGFSGLPKGGVLIPLASDLWVGGAAALDFGYFLPDGAGDVNFLVSAPILMPLFDGAWAGGLRVEPGLGLFTGGGSRAAVLFQASAQAGTKVMKRFWVGGGVETPLAIFVDPFVFVFPVLAGPVSELELDARWHLSFDLKVGPSFLFGSDASEVELGFKGMVGLRHEL